MLDGAVEDLEEEPSIFDINKLQGLSRSAALLTENELNNLVVFLQSINSVAAAASRGEGENDVVPQATNVFDQKQLNDMLSQLPSSVQSASKTMNSSPDTSSKRAGLLAKGTFFLNFLLSLRIFRYK